MPEARVISVNIGQPREVNFRGGRILTGIFKTPVAGSVAVNKLNLAGDRQADLSSRRQQSGLFSIRRSTTGIGP